MQEPATGNSSVEQDQSSAERPTNLQTLCAECHTQLTSFTHRPLQDDALLQRVRQQTEASFKVAKDALATYGYVDSFSFIVNTAMTIRLQGGWRTIDPDSTFKGC